MPMISAVSAYDYSGSWRWLQGNQGIKILSEELGNFRQKCEKRTH